MSDLVLFFFLVIVIVILCVSLTYATDAAAKSEGSSDSYVQSAHSYLTWAVTILWLIIAGIIVLVVLFVIFGAELIPVFGKSFVYLILFILILAILTIGVVSTIAAYDLGNAISPNDSTTTARKDAIIAAVLTLGSFGVVIICNVVTWSSPTPSIPPPDYSSGYANYPQNYPDYSNYNAGGNYGSEGNYSTDGNYSVEGSYGPFQ